MKKKIQFLASALVLIGFVAQAQNPKAMSGTFALTHASIETVTKGVIINGTVLIQKGKITAVGTNVTVPSDATVIDCTGKWIYPGMIDGGTRLGLLEIGQIPQASDEEETGQVVPQMKALTAVNPNSTLIPVTRISGVTTVITAPGGGMFPGTAALINLFGYVPDQMFAGFEGIVMNYPNQSRKGYYDKRTDEEIKKDVEKATKQMNDVWDKAVQYHKLDSATKGKGLTYYPEMIALLPVIRGEQALMIEVNAANDIKAALKWVADRKIIKVIFTGVAEGWRMADEIAKAKIPVVVGPVLEEPTRDYDRYDKPYANAGLLKKAGVKVALRTSQAENIRNLPYFAGFAATYGLGREEALKAITIVPAEIFGVSDKLGSIEVGKIANVFVCDGDPFETKTNIHHVFIDGWQMPMVSRQTQLYEEFLKRAPGLSKN